MLKLEKDEYNNFSCESLKSIENIIWYTKIFVKEIHELNKKEISFIDTHSILNTINAILWYIQIVEYDINKEDHFQNIKNILREFVSQIKNIWDIKECNVENIFNIMNIFIDDLKSIKINENNKEINDDINLITEFIILLTSKINEKIENNFYEFELINIEKLKNKLMDFYLIISKSSRWKFDIVFDKNEKKNNSYYIEISIKSFIENEIYLPKIIIDLIIDLSLNSRKYSNPGTDIIIQINQDEKCTSIFIKDQWIWIPKWELKKIFLLNERWSNVQNKYWNWFWLTKTYYTVKEVFKWDIFVKSEEWIWTEIKIFFPNNIKK